MANATTPVYPPAYLAEYTGFQLTDVAVAFTVIETILVVLRFIARHLQSVKFAIDDGLILVSWILCVALNGIAIAMVHWSGVGFHEVRVYHDSPAIIVLWAKFLVIESFLYLVVVQLPKIAILMIYLRVFPQPVIRRSVYVLGAFMIFYMVLICLVAGFACRPLAFFWDKSLNGQCVDIKSLYQWASFPNIITDICMLILPLPVIWKLQLSTHVKVGLSFTFLTASIGLISSCLRFAQFSGTDPLADGTWASVTLMIWTIIEPGAYLMAACLPTLRPLLIKVRETGRSTIRKASFVSFSMGSSKRSGSNDGSANGSVETKDSLEKEEKGMGSGIRKTTVISMHDTLATQVREDYYV